MVCNNLRQFENHDANFISSVILEYVNEMKNEMKLTVALLAIVQIKVLMNSDDIIFKGFLINVIQNKTLI